MTSRTARPVKRIAPSPWCASSSLPRPASSALEVAPETGEAAAVEPGTRAMPLVDTAALVAAPPATARAMPVAAAAVVVEEDVVVSVASVASVVVEEVEVNAEE